MLSTAQCVAWSSVTLYCPVKVSHTGGPRPCWRGSDMSSNLPSADQTSQGVCCAVRHLPRSRRALLRDDCSRRHVCCQHRAELAASRENNGKPPLNNHDAVVVLGGGLTLVGGIPAWGQQRLKTALKIHKQTSGACPLLCLGGGTPHKPAVLSGTGHVIHESSAYTSYLHTHGVPAKHLLKEVSSYDTVGNAYFCLVIHALPAGWRRLAVVTSDFHMPRTEAIFRHCAKLASSGRDRKDRFELSFHSASDAGIFPADILQARKEREAESLQTWHVNAQRLDTLQQLHHFIHQEHACYSVAHQAAFGQPELDDVNDQALASY